jgi:MFS family permease
MGSLLYLLDKNREKATSSALLESTISVAAIIGPLVGGAIAEVSGLRNVLFFAFFMTLGSFAMSKRLARQTLAAQKVQD